MCPLENDSGLALSNGTEFLAVQPTTPVKKKQNQKIVWKISGLELLAGPGGQGLCCPWSWPWCPFQQFPIDFKIFQWKCPLVNKSGIALSTCLKMKIQAKNLLFFLWNGQRQLRTRTVFTTTEFKKVDNWAVLKNSLVVIAPACVLLAQKWKGRTPR